MRKKERKTGIGKKVIWCGAAALLLSGTAVGIAVRHRPDTWESAEEKTGILTPVCDEASEQEWELALIPDENVPLAAGPGILGVDGGIVSEYVQPAVSENPYIRQVVNLVNEERIKAGLSPLEKADDVSDAAAVRAKELTSSFSHTRPDGSAYRTVLEQRGITYRNCGENVAYGYRTPEAVMSAWMDSEGHKANILNEKYTEIGVGYFTDDSGLGYWTQIFTMKK